MSVFPAQSCRVLWQVSLPFMGSSSHLYSYDIMYELHDVCAAQITGQIVFVKELTGHSDSWS